MYGKQPQWASHLKQDSKEEVWCLSKKEDVCFLRKKLIVCWMLKTFVYPRKTNTCLSNDEVNWLSMEEGKGLS